MEIKIQESEKNKRKEVIPQYHLDKGGQGSHKKRIIIPILVLLLIVSIIYVPPLFLDEKSNTAYDSVKLPENPASLQELTLYKSNNPQADFDGDGLINDVEINQSGTGIYTIDHDGDGVTDYAELYINNPPTNPKVYDDGIVEFVKKQDKLLGTQCNTPFKDAGIIMWADDYSSKARGTVIETYEGVYLFQRFNGFVQFPEKIKSAYQIVNGYQVELKQNEQGYYYIASETEPVYVRVHEDEMQSCGCLELLGKAYQIKNENLSKILTAVLPSKGFGFITCKQVLSEDFDLGSRETAYQNNYQHINLDTLVLADSRFSRNYNQLTDFNNLKSHLEDGDVAIISLVSSNFGESIVEVRGYTNRNNLILCDPLTGADYGILQICVQSSRLLDQSGAITRYEYFSFNGCGYTSANRDRIAIIAYITSTGEISYVNANDSTAIPNNELPDDPTMDEPAIDPSTEPSTEPESTNEPIVEPDPAEILNAVIYATPDGTKEKVVYQSEDGKKIHRIVNGVSLEQYVAHRNTTIQEYGFDYYYSTEGSAAGLYCTTLCDSKGNIVFLKYDTKKQEMLLRYESADVEHVYVDDETGYTIALKPEYFLKEIG